MRVELDALLALCGAGFRLWVNERGKFPFGWHLNVRRGDLLRLEKTTGGSWVYLAAAGGFLSTEWMGSRSVYPRAGLGHPLAAGDRLVFSIKAGGAAYLAGNVIPHACRPKYSENPHVRVILGAASISPADGECADLSGFRKYAFAAVRQNGISFERPNIGTYRRRRFDFAGMVLGEVQVPADGQPIVMMPDHPTTGGYICIGTVARVDLPLLAQAQPGVSQIHFISIEWLRLRRITGG